MKEQLYAPNFVTHKIVLPFTDIGKNIYRTLEQCLEKFEGKWSKVGMPDHGTSNSCTYIQGKGGKHK